MKKVVSLLLVVVLALGMSTVSFAAITNNKKIGGVISGTKLTLDTQPKDWSEIAPGTELYITVNEGMFYEKDGVSKTAPVVATGGIVKSDITKGKVTLKTKIAKGSNVIDEVVWNYKNTNARIKVVFIDPFVSNDTDGQDFDFDVYMAVDGTRYEDEACNFVGTLYNDIVGSIDSDTDYVNLEGGRIVEVDEYAKNVEYYLGEGVSIFGKAFKDKEYYGYCDVDTTDAQELLIDKYDFDEVYNVKTVGLQQVCDYVVITDADQDSYVYNADLKYIGQAKENLEYSSVYYLSSKKLDIDEEIDDEEPTDEEEEFPEAPPVTGGEDDLVENENFNPSTGA